MFRLENRGAKEGVIPSKSKVLVVEDNFLIAGDICEFLRQSGYEPVGPARGVAAAAKMLKEQKIDAAVLDIMLGDRFCYPLCDHLERWNVPYLFVSGTPPSSIPDSYREIPLIAKPFDRALLKRALDKMIAASAAAAAA
jgi:DNA-binding response OmpR family regulator